jgi:hypothetical protein
MDARCAVRILHKIVVISSVVFFPVALWSQQPLRVTVCELKEKTAEFNQKLVEATGFVSHGFEDFGLFDPACPEWPYVWLEYGGTKKSGTVYCCGVSPRGTRAKPLQIEGIEIPATTDVTFEDFDKLIRTERDTVVHATLVGRFFAGKETRFPNGEVEWRGYGHMGCCSLFAVQQVLSVAAHDREDLDYRSSPDQPNIDKVGCGFQDLVRPWPYGDWVKAQQAAELQNDMAPFDSPREAAITALMRLARIDKETAAKLNEMKRAQGRVVYELKTDGGKETYMIVLSKPYLLSFYAKDPQKIAWIVIGAYESSCEKSNSVTRIK